jgi:hypothetical protein
MVALRLLAVLLCAAAAAPGSAAARAPPALLGASAPAHHARRALQQGEQCPMPSRRWAVRLSLQPACLRLHTQRPRLPHYPIAPLPRRPSAPLPARQRPYGRPRQGPTCLPGTCSTATLGWAAFLAPSPAPCQGSRSRGLRPTAAPTLTVGVRGGGSCPGRGGLQLDGRPQPPGQAPAALQAAAWAAFARRVRHAGMRHARCAPCRGWAEPLNERPPS